MRPKLALDEFRFYFQDKIPFIILQIIIHKKKHVKPYLIRRASLNHVKTWLIQIREGKAFFGWVQF